MKICLIDGCERGGRLKKGLCTHHYDKQRNHGDPLFTAQPRVTARCRVDGCEQNMLAKGLCSAHYRRARMYGDPLASCPPGTSSATGLRSTKTTLAKRA